MYVKKTIVNIRKLKILLRLTRDFMIKYYLHLNSLSRSIPILIL